MLQICCVKAGSRYTSEYVNILFDSVKRNLAERTPGEFVCFTDDGTGLDGGMTVRPLPHAGLNGWWNKIALFKPGLFEDGDRILYFDLDTCITGPLDDIIKYQGKFAILRDFYRPKGLQSSVMAWEANTLDLIWHDYEKEGYPQSLAGGDQEWIERKVLSADLWQHLFPAAFRSFKEDCRYGIPKGTKAVVFHGHPRPSEVTEGWVPHIWKINGGSSLEFIVEANVTRETIERNIKLAKQRASTWLKVHPSNDKTALIVAGGPSLKEELSSLRSHYTQGAEIFAVNGSLNYLLTQGIKPRNHVILDAREENVRALSDLVKF